MPRVKKLDKPIPVRFYIPESILTRVKLELWSDLEQKVPFGMMSELVSKLFANWLKERSEQ